MKDNIHPTYYPKAKVICSCGNTFASGSTVKELKVEICSQCHPFYTGQQKFVDTEGRVEKFEKKQVHAKKVAELKAKKEKKQKAEEIRRQDQPKTLKDLLKESKRKQTSSNE